MKLNNRYFINRAKLRTISDFILKQRQNYGYGTFKAVDNQGMAVDGKYTLIEPSNVRFEIFRQGSPPKIVNGTFSLQGDILTVTSANGKEIERYKREKKSSRVSNSKQNYK